MKDLARTTRRRVRTWLRWRAHNALLRRAVNITDRIGGLPAVVLAPHPDDEVIGCGALIARKLEAGSSIDLVYISDGGSTIRPEGATSEEKAQMRAQEARIAAGVLGVPADRLHFLGFPDGVLSEHRQGLQSAIGDLLDRLSPSELYVTSELDPHPDHRVAAEIAKTLSATRPWISVVLEYPVWLLASPWTTWRVRRWRKAAPNVVSVDAANYLEQKRRAFEAYESRKGFGTLQEHFFHEVELFFPLMFASENPTRS